jgi:hypothetical protein
MGNRTKLLISYSHEDIRWLTAVKEQLAVLEREGLLDLYEDTQLQAGEAWYERLQSEMSAAKVGLLLLSAPFLSSGFIRNEEVPKLFDRHARGAECSFIHFSHAHARGRRSDGFRGSRSVLKVQSDGQKPVQHLLVLRGTKYLPRSLAKSRAC